MSHPGARQKLLALLRRMQLLQLLADLRRHFGYGGLRGLGHAGLLHYELGALRALDEAVDGLDLTRLDCYVGVSSGAFLAAGLANRIGTEEMCRGFITGTSDDIRFRPEIILRPNVG